MHIEKILSYGTHLIKTKPQKKMSNMEWNNEAIFRLIDAYRENPVLWDPLDKNYKLLHRKNQAWESIANAFNVDVAEVKKKMNSLLASYRRERQKMIMKQLGTTAEENYHPSWFAFNSLSFLFGKYRPRKRNILETLKDDEDEKESFIGLLDSESDIEDEEETVTEAQYDLSASSSTWKIGKKIPSVSNKSILRRKRFTEEPQLNEIPVTYDFLRSESHLRDECSTYGEHVANKLRKLDGRNRAIAQHNINNILFEAEMKTFYPEAVSLPIPSVPFCSSNTPRSQTHSISSSEISNTQSPVLIKTELSPSLHFENV